LSELASLRLHREHTTRDVYEGHRTANIVLAFARKGDKNMNAKGMTLEEKIDRLADMHVGLNVLEMQKNELLRKVIPPEIMEKIEEIGVEFDGRKKRVEADIMQLTEEVERETIERGATVNGRIGQMMYEARKVITPFVQFRRK
jgi:hypothetical protein